MNFLKELFKEQVIPLSLPVDPQSYFSYSMKLILFLDLVREISKNLEYKKNLCTLLNFMCIKLNYYSIIY